MQLWLLSICNLTTSTFLKFYTLFSLRKCPDICNLQLFLKAGLHSRWECVWNAWRYLYVCWNISIWKDVSHISLSLLSCPHHRKPRMFPACEDEEVPALFIFCCHGPSGKWLLISCRMRSAISEPGSQVGVRPRWLFLKPPKFDAQKYYKTMKVCVI